MARTRKSPPPSPLVQWGRRLLQSRFFIGWAVLTVGFFSCLLFWVKIQHEWGVRVFPVRHVAVSGTYYIDRGQLQKILDPLVTGGFFSLRPERVRESIRAMPWVADAMVRRVWPDRVVIRIQERNPIAYWNKNGLLSMAGEVFSPDEHHRPEGLPFFNGPAGSQLRVLTCYRLVRPLLKSIGSGVTSLELTPLSTWRMTLKNGIHIYLGRQDVLTHLRHFVKVYPGVIGNRTDSVDYVDLRYPDGFAVRWKKQT